MRKLFENINGNSFKTIKESNLSDPSKDEMLEYLRNSYGNEEGFEDDAEIAMYWFANFYHGGQSSNLYSVLSTSRFSPGRSANGPEKDSLNQIMYVDLVLHFEPNSEEAKEIQLKHNSLNETASINSIKYIKNLLKESVEESYFDHLGQALDAVEDFIIKAKIQVDPHEHPANEVDKFGIREPFAMGGISYETYRSADYKLLQFKGKPTKKYLHVVIYRTSNGRYELVRYVL